MVLPRVARDYEVDFELMYLGLSPANERLNKQTHNVGSAFDWQGKASKRVTKKFTGAAFSKA
jgi:hypothetical protein